MGYLAGNIYFPDKFQFITSEHQSRRDEGGKKNGKIREKKDTRNISEGNET